MRSVGKAANKAVDAFYKFVILCDCRRNVAVVFLCKINNAFDQLGNDQKQNECDDQKQGQIGQDQRHRASDPLRAKIEQQPSFIKAEHGIAQISDRETDEDRAKQAQNTCKPAVYRVKIDDEQDAYNEQGIYDYAACEKFAAAVSFSRVHLCPP